jgi:hypothetical protein
MTGETYWCWWLQTETFPPSTQLDDTSGLVSLLRKMLRTTYIRKLIPGTEETGEMPHSREKQEIPYINANQFLLLTLTVGLQQKWGGERANLDEAESLCEGSRGGSISFPHQGRLCETIMRKQRSLTLAIAVLSGDVDCKRDYQPCPSHLPWRCWRTTAQITLVHRKTSLRRAQSY